MFNPRNPDGDGVVEYAELVGSVVSTRWGGLLPMGAGALVVGFDQLPGAPALYALTGHPEWITYATGLGVFLVVVGLGLIVSHPWRTS